MAVKVEHRQVIEAMHRGAVTCVPEASGVSVARVMRPTGFTRSS
jgi:hypothetical protein